MQFNRRRRLAERGKRGYKHGMQELITSLSTQTGLAPATLEKAIGILVQLLREHAEPGPMAELLAKIPGAAALADQHGAAQASGLMGLLGGAMGGPMAAVAKLQGAGLDLEQIKAVGAGVLEHAKQMAGPELVKQVADRVPGLSEFV